MKHPSILLLAMIMAACSDGGTGPGEETPPRVATSLALVGGDGQSGTVGAALPEPLTVRVLDQHGDPMGGVSVSWAATAGGGAFASSSTSTGSDGQATGAWTLGTTAGPNAARASVAGISTPVDFTATGVAGSPAALIRHAGDGQTGPAGHQLHGHGDAERPDHGDDLAVGRAAVDHWTDRSRARRDPTHDGSGPRGEVVITGVPNGRRPRFAGEHDTRYPAILRSGVAHRHVSQRRG